VPTWSAFGDLSFFFSPGISYRQKGQEPEAFFGNYWQVSCTPGSVVEGVSIVGHLRTFDLTMVLSR
jgi:hypothetical protein